MESCMMNDAHHDACCIVMPQKEALSETQVEKDLTREPCIIVNGTKMRCNTDDGLPKLKRHTTASRLVRARPSAGACAVGRMDL